ncbi:hypothetical protein OC844_004487 [Tilletia horrida]|nr:hypothetical protein OC844_004487 [Tilletia horrida]
MRSAAARKAGGSALAKAACAASSQDLARLALAALQDASSGPLAEERGIRFTTSKGRSFFLGTAFHTSEIQDAVKDQVLALLRANMKDMYDQSRSIHWNDDEKRADVDHEAARLLLAWDDSPTPALAGYVLFRFDVEEVDDDDPCVRRGQDEVEIAYCYELQIAPGAQHSGLGQVLMRTLEHISRATQLRKVMLTCFSFNQDARKFYEAQGYELDLISPLSEDEDDDEEMREAVPDYRIMSKRLIHQ